MFKVKSINILNASEDELLRISQEGLLSLSLTEMQAIQEYFSKKGRNPTDVEIETMAQTWSEHCVHKTFKSRIEYTEYTDHTEAESGKTEIIDGLLRSTIMKATYEINKPWCLSLFSDNAGVIEFDENYGLAFKVETHNHPSAIEPYGGAGTGIGGVIRDSLGTGLGAKPILDTDVFCFGPPDLLYDKLPKGSLHPKRVFKGVVAGVRDYGNRLGIPTSNGAILFDERYTSNPLVYCGNLGLIPKDRCQKAVRAGDLIVAVGGRTGRDGIHGATFSSLELDDASEALGSVVQIGNPIVEKKLVDALICARDRGLYEAITDCGAGGFSSAVGEMGKETGARVYLEKVPLKYEGLVPWEVWLSESQERMVLAVPPQKLEELIEIFRLEDVEATPIGEFTSTGKLEIFYQTRLVGELDMNFLHNGLPKMTKKAIWPPVERRHVEMQLVETPYLASLHEPNIPLFEDLTPYLKLILSSPNVCSKEWVIRQYDHEVQGSSGIKPLQGAKNDGPGDACAITPLLGSKRAAIVSNGINPKYGDIDPYWMAAAAIDEAVRNVICVGGKLDRIALLDNFSWGNPDKPDQLGGLVRAAKACYDISVAYDTPFISGKDSLNNEYRDTSTGEQLSIPPTLLISALCVIEDISMAVSMDLKAAGDLVYILGKTYNELGGSHYYSLFKHVGKNVPKVKPDESKKNMIALSQAIHHPKLGKLRMVRSCHDCSEGGIGVAAAEMAFSGDLGMKIDLRNIPKSEDVVRNDMALFSESNSRFIVEVPKEVKTEFETFMESEGADFALLGKVTDDERFEVIGFDGNVAVSATIYDLKEAWQKTLRWS